MARRRVLRALAGAAIATVLTSACSGSDAESRPSIDSDALFQMSLEAFDGSTIRLSDLGDRPIVVNFWATDCATCVYEMPAFQEVHAELGATVAFVGVDVDDRAEEADEFATATGVTYLLVRDPDFEVATAFGAPALPTTIVFAADRSVVDLHLGALSADDLRDRIDDAFAT